MSRSFVIGIVGGSGSGKSTLAHHLLGGEYGPQMSVLAHDAYYLDGGRIPADLRRDENFDHPDTLDNGLFVEHIDDLRAGRAVERPVYDFKTHIRQGETERVPPRPILLLDGILLFAIPEIRDRIDLRVYVDTSAEERLARRILRDIAERGRTVVSVVHQFRTTVRPMHDRFVEPSRVHAHIVIPWDWACDHRVAVDVVASRIGVAVAADHAARERAPREMARSGHDEQNVVWHG